MDSSIFYWCSVTRILLITHLGGVEKRGHRIIGREGKRGDQEVEEM